MAGDWMKIELELPDKPEVHYIAGVLNMDPAAVVGHLIKVWAWFDKHTENGNAYGVTQNVLDRVTGVAGMGEAMMLAGWLEQSGKTLIMPKFERHTSESAKKRALSQKRTQRFRNDDVTQKTLPEKRREENISTKAADALSRPDQVSESVWNDFLSLRKTKKAPLTKTALKGIEREAGKAGLSLQVALEMCCARGWQGFESSWVGGDGKSPQIALDA